ncbi:energy transducer TonB [Prosthecobacter debontii]|nr:energy transducer TonB [Prosthecobacter debontii]
MRQVTGAVEDKWQTNIRLRRDPLNFGRVRIRFDVDREGHPQDIKFLSSTADSDLVLRELTLRAVLDAQIPPIPADLLPTLDDGRVKIEYEAIVY